MISIHEFKESKLRRYYGASRRVYQQSSVDTLIRMWGDLHYLSELKTRTMLVPCNEDFLNNKAIPAYNSTLTRMQKAYPNIKEFHYYEPIK